MKASWLEAVAAGEDEGFSRHFVPDILTALATLRCEADRMRERVEKARHPWGCFCTPTDEGEHDEACQRLTAALAALEKP